MDKEKNIFKLIRTIELFSNESMLTWSRSFQRSVGISSILVLQELRQKGAQKQTELASTLGYTPGAMTNIASKLINEAYAIRKYDAGDRRVIRLEITEKGVQLLEEAQQKGTEIRKEMFEVLSEEEVSQFLAIQEKLLRHIESKPK
ncbi:MarR family winged helix-turn-helix transcriptional regulator [Virgibacillus halodenitrificans]|uniref:MarR family transcriptional regulator n=1 Tax=Virgibacillus halodenitrificans TaxID=1482 RepID=A0AAC9J3A3_VIRHA|nr:MarR family transcriptional regulator [Virgibacillus halodenitrificans]APC49924.1 MarR family transcriptional regulator [Virgibacillus halodenitrificans]MBD1223558.1 MarR family transcriptional regulator [Virgibacillus halodenitrificans]MCJ0932074.1 MarR family transcriptional regulator [Virgibacillus halodenitrificans]MEC2157842.1 MarR family transcriptional regulator [Virgibacillus halodenitrificans]MYL44186.1 MarR family transcriptional regulator [Virgibacillus halodenitrificans]